MKIAIHTGWVGPSPANSYWQLISEAVIQLAASQPTHQFLVVGPQKIGDATTTNNLLFEAVVPKSSLGMVRNWWYRRQVAKAVLRQNADLFFNLDPDWKAGLDLPQVWLLHPHWMMLTRDWLGEKKPSAKRIELLQKLQGLCVGYTWQAEKLAAKTGINMANLQVTGPTAMPAFRPLAWVEKEAAKTTITGGQEYLLYYGSVANTGDLVILLKAFSLFKKRQKCNLQLVIAMSQPEGHAALQHKLASYKYRSDVRVLQEPTMTDLARLAGASYAVIAHEKFQPGWWLLGCMQVETALAAVPTPTLNEICGNAHADLSGWNTDALAQAMMQLYKDENYRSQLIASGTRNIADKGMHKVVAALWTCIEKACQPT